MGAPSFSPYRSGVAQDRSFMLKGMGGRGKARSMVSPSADGDLGVGGVLLLVRSNLGEGDIVFVAPFFCGGKAGASRFTDQAFRFRASTWLLLH
jgi:hypothetical protein